MDSNRKPVSAVTGTSCRQRQIVAGALALATLLPVGAFAMDGTTKVTPDRAGDVLPLPPIHYLDSMLWMDSKSSAPAFKADTLLLPDSAKPGVFRLPSGYEPDLSHVS
jgi:hypothetical protein